MKINWGSGIGLILGALAGWFAGAKADPEKHGMLFGFAVVLGIVFGTLLWRSVFCGPGEDEKNDGEAEG